MEERTQLRNPAKIREKKERAQNDQDESTDARSEHHECVSVHAPVQNETTPQPIVNALCASTMHARLSTNSVDMLVHVRRFSAHGCWRGVGRTLLHHLRRFAAWVFDIGLTAASTPV